MTNNNPYMRKETLTLLGLSAIALLLASPLLSLSNLLLQPAQGSVGFSARTLSPAGGELSNKEKVTLTFDGKVLTEQQTATGTFQIANTSGGILYGGNFIRGTISGNNGELGGITLEGQFNQSGAGTLSIDVNPPCVQSTQIVVTMESGNFETLSFIGPVDCSYDGGGETATQPSSTSSGTGATTTTTTPQDSDSDGIPDSSDNCPHNSNHRCFKEAGASTTTQQQQQSSSSSRTGNQTR